MSNPVRCMVCAALAVGLLAGSRPNAALGDAEDQAAEPPARYTETSELPGFTGPLHTGLHTQGKFDAEGDVEHFREFAVFFDRVIPRVEVTADQTGLDASLTASVACHSDDLLQLTELARRIGELVDGQGLLGGPDTHIVVLPAVGTEVFGPIETPYGFVPAEVTRLPDVIEKCGPPRQTQPWPGLNVGREGDEVGPVHWWGAVGLAAAQDGTIEFLLVREVTRPADAEDENAGD